MANNAVVGILRALLTLDQAEFENGMKKAADSAKVFSREWQTVGRQASDVGSKLSVTVTAPLLAMAAGLTAIGVQFDAARDQIRAATGATGEALASLSDSFEKVFARVPNSMSDVATAISGLATRTGLAGAPLEALATQLLNLGRITGEQMPGLIEASTRLFGDWSVATADQAHTLDYLYRTTEQTGIGFTKLTETIVQFGAPMRALGFSLEESAALVGKWEKEGVNMDTVLSGLRFGLGKFAAAGVEPKQAMIQIEEAIRGARSESEATGIAFQVFGKRAAVDMSRAIIEGRFSVDDLVTSLKGGHDTINQAAADTLSFADKLKQLGNQVRVAVEPIATQLIGSLEKLIPALQGALGFVAELASLFAKLPAPVQEGIFVFAGLVAAVGPVLFTFGQLALSIAAVAKLFAAGGLLAEALPAILPFLGPAGAIVIGVIAVYEAWKHWDEIAAFAKAVYDGVKTWLVDKFDAVVNSIGDKVKAVTGFFSDLYDDLVGHSIIPDLLKKLGVHFGPDLDNAMTKAVKKATADVKKSFVELDAEIFSATAHHETFNEVLDAFGKKASEAVEQASRYGLAISKMTTDLAAAYQLAEAHRLEQVGPGVPTMGGGAAAALKESEAYYDALFKARESIETESLKRSADRETAAAEHALAMDKSRGASAATLASDIEILEQAKLAASISSENRRFALETADVDKTTELYRILAANHKAIVEDMDADWRAGIEEREGATLGFGARFGQEMSTALSQIGPVLLSAFEGGGDPGKSVGGLLGGHLATSLMGDATKGTGLTGFLNKHLGEKLGGAIGSVIPGLGTLLGGMAGDLIGPLIGKIGGFFKGLFGGPSGDELKARDVANQWAESLGAVATATEQVTIKQLIAQGGTQQWAEMAVVLQDKYRAVGLTGDEAMSDIDRLQQATHVSGAAVAAVIAEITGKLHAEGAAADSTADDIKALVASYDGSAIFRQAQIAVQAVQQLGGATKLTASEAQTLWHQLDEAIQKYEAMGLEVPADLAELDHALYALVHASDDLNTSLSAPVTKTVTVNWGGATFDVSAYLRMMGYNPGGGGNGTSEGKDTSNIFAGLSPADAQAAWLAGVASPGSTAQDWNRVKDQYNLDPSKVPAGDPNHGGTDPNDHGQFATGTRGRFLDFGQGTLVTLHGLEGIVPIGEVGSGGEWDRVFASLADAGGGDLMAAASSLPAGVAMPGGRGGDVSALAAEMAGLRRDLLHVLPAISERAARHGAQTAGRRR